jgi:hypothetical protein
LCRFLFLLRRASLFVAHQRCRVAPRQVSTLSADTTSCIRI